MFFPIREGSKILIIFNSNYLKTHFLGSLWNKTGFRIYYPYRADAKQNSKVASC